MINNQLFNLIAVIIFVYILGDIFLNLFFRKFITTLNLFLKLGYAWVLGNFILIFGLLILTFTNQLSYITQTNFYCFLGILLTVFIYQNLKRQEKGFSKKTIKEIFWLLLIVVFYFDLIINSLTQPMINFDALAMWFLKARSFFYNNGLINNSLFSNPAFNSINKSYPLGLPLLIAFYWRLINFSNDQTVQLLLLFYYFNSLFVFFGFLKQNFPKINSLIWLLITLSVFILPIMVIYSHNGYADLPLSFSFLAATSLLIKQILEKDSNLKKEIYCLLLFSLGIGCLYKKEGISFAGVALLFSTLDLLLKKTKDKPNWFLLQPFLFLIGAFLPLVMWEIYVKTAAFPFYLSSILNQFSSYKLSYLFNFGLMELVNTAKYGFVFFTAAVLTVINITWTVRQKKWSWLLPTTILILQFGFYFYVYLITPMPFELQVKTSFERLVLQVLPSFCLTALWQSFSFII